MSPVVLLGSAVVYVVFGSRFHNTKQLRDECRASGHRLGAKSAPSAIIITNIVGADKSLEFCAFNTKCSRC